MAVRVDLFSGKLFVFVIIELWGLIFLAVTSSILPTAAFFSFISTRESVRFSAFEMILLNQ
jgi:hypothetical protein